MFKSGKQKYFLCHFIDNGTTITTLELHRATNAKKRAIVNQIRTFESVVSKQNTRMQVLLAVWKSIVLFVEKCGWTEKRPVWILATYTYTYFLGSVAEHNAAYGNIPTCSLVWNTATKKANGIIIVYVGKNKRRKCGVDLWRRDQGSISIRSH